MTAIGIGAFLHHPVEIICAFMLPREHGMDPDGNDRSNYEERQSDCGKDDP